LFGHRKKEGKNNVEIMEIFFIYLLSHLLILSLSLLAQEKCVTIQQEIDQRLIQSEAEKNDPQMVIDQVEIGF
jgi:hypothetical protein